MSLEATLIETNTLLKQIIAIYTTSVEAVATLGGSHHAVAIAGKADDDEHRRDAIA